MEYRTLGSTGLNVSAIGLGTWAMGGRWWGEVNDSDSIAVIKTALELGINFFDTADLYGFGHSEKILGEAVEKERRNVILATKVGLRWNNKGKIRHDLSPAYILQAVDASLTRLKTDYIDLYQVHWPDPNTPIEKTADALRRCVEAGKVRYLGASNLSPAQLQKYRELCPIETLQPPLNLFERYAEVQLLPICLKEDIGVVSYSTLCRGLLSGKFKAGAEFQEAVRKRDPLFKGATFERNIGIVERLREVAQRSNKTVAQLAIAWVLAHPSLSVALCGARKLHQFEENVGAANWRLSQDQLEEIEKILVNTQPTVDL